MRCAGEKVPASYGAGLARYLRTMGIEVLEVERPEHRRRSSRRNLQKSDPSDAELPHERFWPEKCRACPRAATALWR